ncbi:MAG: DUF5667 domain-containing protein [Pseudonocardia sp.]
MPAEQGKDAAERFAAAVEQGRTPRLHSDDELARELEIVAMLRSRGPAYAPHPDAKARAKQRLMAAFAEQNPGVVAPPVAPVCTQSAGTPAERTAPMVRLVDEPARSDDDASITEPARSDELAAVTELAPRAARRAGRHTLASSSAGRAQRNRRSDPSGFGRRVGLVSSAALLVMVALTGAGMFVSRDALPGDATYGIKRVAEEAGLALTFDDEARARRNLELAAVRLSEIEQLVARDDRSSLDPLLLSSAMQQFGVSASEGSRTLLTDEQATEAGGIGDLQTWAAKQVVRLSVLRSALPVPAATEADNSIALLDRVMGRTAALETRSSCSEPTSGSVDDLGPVPADGSCTPQPINPPSRAGGNLSQNTEQTAPGGGDQNGTGTPDGTDVSSGPESTDELPQTGPDTVPLNTSPDRDQAPSQTPAGEQDGPLLPLPLKPPATLPPLLPGMPSLPLG